jgi:hypothetical protein
MEGTACRPCDVGPGALFSILDRDGRCDLFCRLLLVRAGTSHRMATDSSEPDPKWRANASISMERSCSICHDKFRSIYLVAVYAGDHFAESYRLVDRSSVAASTRQKKKLRNAAGDRVSRNINMTSYTSAAHNYKLIEGDSLSYKNKWKQTIIKSFRLSPALLDMIEAECRVKRTRFSKFVRYAVNAALKPGRYQATGH